MRYLSGIGMVHWAMCHRKRGREALSWYWLLRAAEDGALA